MTSMDRRAMLRTFSSAALTIAGMALVPSAAQAVLLPADPMGDGRDGALVETAQAVVVVPRHRRRVCRWRRGRRVCTWR